MMTLRTSPVDAPFAVGANLGVLGSEFTVGSRVHGVVNVSPSQVSPEGQNRLQGAARIATGENAHAAVRMHDFTARGFFWGYCPKTKTRHSQRSKVAT